MKMLEITESRDVTFSGYDMKWLTATKFLTTALKCTHKEHNQQRQGKGGVTFEAITAINAYDLKWIIVISSMI
jgi:hypothetical protein